MKFYCKCCSFCEQIGRQNSTWSSVGRKRYYCKHEGISNIRDRHGFLIDGFVGFGENNLKSSLVLKTSPRWCPRKKDEKKMGQKGDKKGTFKSGLHDILISSQN